MNRMLVVLLIIIAVIAVVVALAGGCCCVLAPGPVPGPYIPGTLTTTARGTEAARPTNSPGPANTPLSPTPASMTRLDGKRALFVIYERFEENEYGIPRAILEDRGVVVTVASSSSDVVKGHKGTEVRPDVLLGDVRASDYDAIVFIGGYEYERDDPEAQRIAREAIAESKVVAAICIAPITLAKAGVVEGKRVTASTGAAELKKAGATFTGASVERDGLIITANGPAAARQFGEAIAAALEE